LFVVVICLTAVVWFDVIVSTVYR